MSLCRPRWLVGHWRDTRYGGLKGDVRLNHRGLCDDRGLHSACHLLDRNTVRVNAAGGVHIRAIKLIVQHQRTCQSVVAPAVRFIEGNGLFSQLNMRFEAFCIV